MFTHQLEERALTQDSALDAKQVRVQSEGEPLSAVWPSDPEAHLTESIQLLEPHPKSILEKGFQLP